ncbi:MAG: ribosome recycling factor [Candidatus Cloacimonetes bacterium]|nr:ribosome recycling factor [Candidatus Cloacimonadota bacterium]
MEETLLEIDIKMEKAFESLTHNFRKLRTGRASAAVLDDIKIDYYGQATPIKQMCNISIPEPRLIVIQPWDKTTLADIEKGILAANLGITPDNDGNVIRLPFPQLTEDKRRDIVKQVKKMAEEAKVSVRNVRREANDIAKKMKKESDLTEDEEKRAQSDIQELTDKWTDKVSETAASKESEIMEV